MFRAAPASPAAPRDRRVPLRRALWMAGGLVVLWGAMQLVPAPAPPPTGSAAAPVADAAAPSFDTGTVAGRPLGLREERSLFSPGYLVALLILAGGAWWALTLRRKATAETLPAAALQSLGTLTLTPGQTLHLVACGADVLLVGQGAGGVTLLATYPRETFEKRPRVTALPSAPGPEPAPPTPGPTPEAQSFGELLRARAPHLFAAEEGRAA